MVGSNGPTLRPEDVLKHLVYLCDGTWMFPGSKKSNSSFTNIHRLNNRLEFLDRDLQHQQFVYYSRGLGSGYTYIKIPQGVLGWGIWNDIEELYLNVCSNYDPNERDRIYLFGFSRGSIIARVAAGLISYGVLRLSSFDHISDIRTLYQLDSKEKRGVALSEREQLELAKARRNVEENTHSRKPEIEFLGLFDSVVGGDRWIKSFQELGVVESRPADNVKVTVQILSLDEERSMFKPSWFKFPPSLQGSILEQIWFPGVHSDVGGGAENIDLPKIALLTMIDRALLHTRLNILHDDLVARFCRPFEEKLMIESEWSLFWRTISLFRKVQRKAVGEAASIHPLADYLSEKNHKYKNNKLNSTRERPELARIDRTKIFMSEELTQYRLLPESE